MESAASLVRADAALSDELYTSDFNLSPLPRHGYGMDVSLGHRPLQVWRQEEVGGYTALSPTRFKDFWRE
jgi:hypothetical protein